MIEPITVLILAGGFATRLWPLTEKRAKPLLPIAGKPLICHIIDQVPRETPIIISTNQAFQEDFFALKQQYPDRNLSIFIEDSTDDKAKKGALGATSLAIQAFHIDSPLLLIAGDNYFGFDLSDFIQHYHGTTLLASFDTKSLQAARQFGVLEVKEGKLVSFVEKPEDPPSTLVSTGCYLFSPQHLPLLQDYARLSADNLGGIFEYLLKRNESVDVYSFDAPWIDIGSFESYLNAHRLLSPENRIASSSQVTNSELGSSVEIAEHCSIENCLIEESIILEGCQIKDARIRGCIIDKNCVIEGVDLDHKMIRGGSEIRGA
ncbi:MAG: sugar phosphate nucleotidyltransferase [Candidatus Altimarinota bacterium]